MQGSFPPRLEGRKSKQKQDLITTAMRNRNQGPDEVREHSLNQVTA